MLQIVINSIFFGFLMKQKQSLLIGNHTRRKAISYKTQGPALSYKPSIAHDGSSLVCVWVIKWYYMILEGWLTPVFNGLLRQTSKFFHFSFS